MVIENFEVILVSKLHRSNYNNFASPDFFKLFYNPEMRKLIGRASQIIILQNTIHRDDLLCHLMEISKSEYNEKKKLANIDFTHQIEFIEKGLSMLEQFSFIKKMKDEDGNYHTLILTEKNWDELFRFSLKDLHNKFGENLNKLKGSGVYRCSKQCVSSIYTSQWVSKKGYKCINGHRLQFIPIDEKNNLIKNIKYDISVLGLIDYPLKIIKDIRTKYSKVKLYTPKLPIFKSSPYVFFMNCLIISNRFIYTIYNVVK